MRGAHFLTRGLRRGAARAAGWRAQRGRVPLRYLSVAAPPAPDAAERPHGPEGQPPRRRPARGAAQHSPAAKLVDQLLQGEPTLGSVGRVLDWERQRRVGKRGRAGQDARRLDAPYLTAVISKMQQHAEGWRYACAILLHLQLNDADALDAVHYTAAIDVCATSFTGEALVALDLLELLEAAKPELIDLARRGHPDGEPYLRACAAAIRACANAPLPLDRVAVDLLDKRFCPGIKEFLSVREDRTGKLAAPAPEELAALDVTFQPVAFGSALKALSRAQPLAETSSAWRLYKLMRSREADFAALSGTDQLMAFKGALLALCRAGRKREALEVLRDIRRHRLTPDLTMCEDAIQLCVDWGDVRAALQLRERLYKQGVAMPPIEAFSENRRGMAVSLNQSAPPTQEELRSLPNAYPRPGSSLQKAVESLLALLGGAEEAEAEAEASAGRAEGGAAGDQVAPLRTPPAAEEHSGDAAAHIESLAARLRSAEEKIRELELRLEGIFAPSEGAAPQSPQPGGAAGGGESARAPDPSQSLLPDAEALRHALPAEEWRPPQRSFRSIVHESGAKPTFHSVNAAVRYLNARSPSAATVHQVLTSIGAIRDGEGASASTGGAAAADPWDASAPPSGGGVALSDMSQSEVLDGTFDRLALKRAPWRTRFLVLRVLHAELLSAREEGRAPPPLAPRHYQSAAQALCHHSAPRPIEAAEAVALAAEAGLPVPKVSVYRNVLFALARHRSSSCAGAVAKVLQVLRAIEERHLCDPEGAPAKWPEDTMASRRCALINAASALALSGFVSASRQLLAAELRHSDPLQLADEELMLALLACGASGRWGAALRLFERVESFRNVNLMDAASTKDAAALAEGAGGRLEEAGDAEIALMLHGAAERLVEGRRGRRAAGAQAFLDEELRRLGELVVAAVWDDSKKSQLAAVALVEEQVERELLQVGCAWSRDLDMCDIAGRAQVLARVERQGLDGRDPWTLRVAGMAPGAAMALSVWWMSTKLRPLAVEDAPLVQRACIGNIVFRTAEDGGEANEVTKAVAAMLLRYGADLQDSLGRPVTDAAAVADPTLRVAAAGAWDWVRQAPWVN